MRNEEHETQNVEHRTQNAEQGVLSPEREKRKAEHGTQIRIPSHAICVNDRAIRMVKKLALPKTLNHPLKALGKGKGSFEY